MALDPNTVLDTLKTNHAENVLGTNVQNALLGLLTTAIVGTFTWLITFLRKIGRMEAQIEAQQKALEASNALVLKNKEIFDEALKESKEVRERINSSIQTLHEEHSRTRETLAAQPTKEDLREMERRISNLIFRKPPDDFFNMDKPR
jgi:septal ring factor EnvC (AmiA/AmiB activator)